MNRVNPLAAGGVVIGLGWLAGALLAAGAATAAPGGSDVLTFIAPDGQPVTAARPGYAGTQTCVTCHDGYERSVGATAHGFGADRRTPAATDGCESCHGPSEAHAGDPTLVAPAIPVAAAAEVVNQPCQSCHLRGRVALWEGSPHENRNLRCADCHRMHASAGPTLLSGRSETLVCAPCHRPVTNRTLRFNHMPLGDGKLTCSSCHNAHGTINVRLLGTGATIDQSCTSCHADKRGPFLWEHAPVVESCTTCHDAHGSSHDRMLVAKQPFLCQRCHVTSRHPPAVYDGFQLNTSQNANKMFGKSCVNCHQQVHGSNHPAGKFFTR